MLTKKQLLAGAMALVLAIGLGACGSTDDTPSSDPTATPATSSPTATPAPVTSQEPVVVPEGDAFAEKGLSKYDSLVTLTYPRYVDTGATFAPGQSYEDNIYITEYRDILGIEAKVHWEAESVEDYNDKINRGIISNDLPDAFNADMSTFANLIKANMLYDITDAYEEWATPFYKENVFVADNGAGLEKASIDGRLYGIPRAGIAKGAFQFMYVREDWRLKLGMPEPTTYEAMLDLARAFTTQDPDGNGVPDTYGFAVSNQFYETWHSFKAMFNMFGAYPTTWVDKNGKAEYGVVQPEMKTALTAFNSWYNEGLINKEFVAMDSYSIYAPTNAGITFGEGWLLGWPLPETLRAADVEWRPYMIPFAPGAEGKIAAEEKLGGVTVVRAGYDHPEAMIKMCNLFMERVMSFKYDTKIYKSDDQYNYESLAVFAPTNGIDRNARNDNILNEILGMETPDLLKIENIDQSRKFMDMVEGIFMQKYDIAWTEENADRYTVAYNTYWGNYGSDSLWGISKKMEADNMFLVDLTNGVITESMILYSKQLESDAQEMINNIVAGVEPLDYFDEFVSNWWATGGQDITDEVDSFYQTVK